MRRLAALAVCAIVAACAPAPVGPAQSLAREDCQKKTLTERNLTVTPGKLTWGADMPVSPPYYMQTHPNGQGFEAALANEVSRRLGYSPAVDPTASEVLWINQAWGELFQPGKKKFDFTLNQATITAQRGQVVDFSTPYLDNYQAALMLNTSISKHKIDPNAPSAAAIGKLKLGAISDTTSFVEADSLDGDGRTPAAFSEEEDSLLALRNGQIDVLLLDIGAALYASAARLDGEATVVGKIVQKNNNVEQFGIVLTDGSPLLACVDNVIRDMKDDGTLKGLEDLWLEGLNEVKALT